MAKNKGKAKGGFKATGTVEDVLPQIGGEYVELPTGDFGPNVTWEKKGQEIEGELIALRTVTIKNKPQRVITLRTADGDRSLWEAKGLITLFDNFAAIQGYTAKITFTDTVKVKGRREPMRLFRVFVKR